MLGLADKNHRYLDLNAYYDLAEAAEHPTAAPTAAPTESPAAESPTQTVLYVIIGVLAAAVVALVLTRGRKKGGINQQEAAETKPLPPEVPDEPTQQVEEASKARVALACIGGALQGMTFPIPRASSSGVIRSTVPSSTPRTPMASAACTARQNPRRTGKSSSSTSARRMARWRAGSS